MNKYRKKKKHSGERKNQLKKPQRIERIVEGRISVAFGGFGFVALSDGEGPDVFIPAKYMREAMDGDIVEVGITEEAPRTADPGRGPRGKIINIIKRNRNSIVGELIAGHRVRPIGKKFPDDIKISGSLRGAKRGDWVEVSLLDTRAKEYDGPVGTLKTRIGKAGEIQYDLDAVMCEYELCAPYTEKEDSEAGKLKMREVPREDLSGLFCVTVDPHDAKDYDDAISIAPGKGKNEIELGVHIADAAAWIEPGSKWDKEARRRAFTSYLPGRTLPMLPKSLTRKISLGTDKKSPAHSVIMTIDTESGKVKNARRFHSLIKVTKRLNFDEVQNSIENNPPDDWDDEFCEKMKSLVEAARIIRRRRQKTESFMELAATEIRVLCDEEKNQIIGVEKREQKDSDILVEECMLAANSEVAGELVKKSIPGIFRTHHEPTPDKLEEFTVFISETFGLYPGDITSRGACNRFLSALPDDHKRPVILNAFVRSLPRATYLEECEFHFGLGKDQYCHFTSPIRRYPDLVVHQQLWGTDFSQKIRSKKKMEKYAAECSEKEIKNDEAYYSANDRLKLRYLNSDPENLEILHEAVIMRINSSGLLVDVVDLGILGFVPLEYLGGRFKYSKKIGRLNSLRGNQNYKCGDFIYLKLDRIDFIRATAIFRPVT